MPKVRFTSSSRLGKPVLALKNSIYIIILYVNDHGRRGATRTGTSHIDLSPTKWLVLHFTDDQLCYFYDKSDKKIILSIFMH